MGKSFIHQTLTANQQPTNYMGGDANEFVMQDSKVLIRAVSDTAGATITLFADNDMLMDNKEIPYIGTTLVDKDHVVHEYDVEAGTRLMVKLGELLGGTPDVYVGVEVIPLE